MLTIVEKKPLCQKATLLKGTSSNNEIYQ